MGALDHDLRVLDAVTRLAPPEVRRALVEVDALHCRLARRDPAAFVSYVLRDEGTGAPVLPSPAHEEWQALLTAHRRVGIWSHVEAGKSSQVSVARVLYELGRDPSLRCVVVMNTDAQAQKLARVIGRYIEQSPELRRVFPRLVRDRSRPWTSHQLSVVREVAGHAKDPSVQTCGLHGNILGARIDLLVLDDFIDYESTRTQHGREDTMNWYLSTLEGRLTRNARVWAVGMAWHRDDFLHTLAKSPQWHFRRFPVMAPDGTPTWPARWPKERIEEKRAVLGPAEFSRQLMCVARADEDARFKRAWVDTCLARGEGRGLIYALAAVPPGYRVFTGVDLGVRVKDGSDLTVLFTIAIAPNGDRQVLDVQSGRWPGPEIVRRIVDVHNRYRSIALVENNAAQQFIVDFTRGGTGVPVQPYTTTGKVNSPEFGIESMAVEMAAGKWVIPNTGGVMHPEVAAWVQELLYYDPRSHAGDRLMASWFAREGAGKVTVSTGARSVDLLSR